MTLAHLDFINALLVSYKLYVTCMYLYLPRLLFVLNPVREFDAVQRGRLRYMVYIQWSQVCLFNLSTTGNMREFFAYHAQETHWPSFRIPYLKTFSSYLVFRWSETSSGPFGTAMCNMQQTEWIWIRWRPIWYYQKNSQKWTDQKFHSMQKRQKCSSIKQKLWICRGKRLQNNEGINPCWWQMLETKSLRSSHVTNIMSYDANITVSIMKSMHVIVKRIFGEPNTCSSSVDYSRVGPFWKMTKSGEFNRPVWYCVKKLTPPIMSLQEKVHVPLIQLPSTFSQIIHK